MRRRTFIKVVGQGCAAVSVGQGMVSAGAEARGQQPSPPTGGRGPVPAESDWETVSALLDDASSTYKETWDDATCRTLMKGGYLGNGDFGVHLGGTIHSLKYYLGKNGFHAGNDVAAGRYNQDRKSVV